MFAAIHEHHIVFAEAFRRNLRTSSSGRCTCDVQTLILIFPSRACAYCACALQECLKQVVEGENLKKLVNKTVWYYYLLYSYIIE